MDGIPISLRAIIGVAIGLAIVMVYYVYLNSKEKSEYETTTGSITYLDKQFGPWPTKDIGKYRYLQVDGYEYPFEIFVGNESGDFKPEFERIDNLHPGDTITVFYYQTENTHEERINRFIQYIDKKDDSYFVRGSTQKKFGAVMILLCALLAIGGVVLWKMKKIPF